MKNILLISLLFFLSNVYAQKQKILGLGYDIVQYRGDFEHAQTYKSALTLLFRLNQNKFLTGEFQFRAGNIEAQTPDPIATQIAPFVKTNFASLNYGLNFRLYNWKNRLAIHITPGIGLLRFTPKSAEGTKLSGLTNSRQKNESYGSTAIVLPIKLGVNYATKYKVNYGFNIGYLNTRTDYLDNVSKLMNGEDKDNVFFAGLNISYFLTK